MAKSYRGRDAFKRAQRKRSSEARKRLTPQVDRKARVGKRWSRYNSKRRPASHTVAAEGKLVLPETKYTRIRPDAIRIRAGQDATDENVVSSIAESFVVTGQVHPVIVRRVGLNVELIWGADVVAAAKAAKLDSIEIQHFKGNDDEARLLQVAEALFRKELTALEKAEQWAEWADGVLKTKGLFSGQPVPKKGRPEGDVLKAARLLPAYGSRTLDARKKMLARAYQIARLPSDVKEAIKKAGLDNNQTALLAVASAGGAESQHRKLDHLSKKLAEIPEVQSPPLQPAVTATDVDHENDKRKQSDSSTREKDREAKDSDDDDDADSEESAGDDQDDEKAGEEREGEDARAPEMPPPDTDLKQLRQFWKEHGGTNLWAYTPMTVRKEFIDWLASRPCRANSDVEPYVKDVFAGRQQIGIRVLKAHATSKGFSHKQILSYLKQNGYVRQKAGSSPIAPQVYKNCDPNFRGVSSVTKEQLEAPFNEEIDALIQGQAKQTPTNLDRADKGEDYYNIK